MTLRVQPSDLELAALISSKICHDAINPVGAINNGLEMLDDDKDADAQKYALDMIRNVTAQASARLEFARMAFGASNAAGSTIDLSKAESVTHRYVSPQEAKSKHRLTWTVPRGFMAKDKGKLLLNLVAVAVTALPRGGEIAVSMSGTIEDPSFTIRCTGQSARAPQYLMDYLSGTDPELDSMSIQSYYAYRLATGTDTTLAIVKDGADVVITAKAA